ncbi:MAG: hypothetical protein E6J05_13485 [Chloroflexi bacterium]|nr:MAG: hypothetical protein E6J05_13485 [Chloroflexota bacterium]
MRPPLALLLSALLLASCASGAAAGRSTPTVAASPSGVPTQLSVDKQWKLGPVADVAVGVDAVYVLYAPPTSEGALSNATDTRLARIDRVSGRVVTAGPYPFAMRVALSGGVLWIGPNNQYPGTAASDSRILTGVDAQSLLTVRRVTLPNDPAPLALIANLTSNSSTVWVAYATHLYRLNAGSGAILASRRLSGVATSASIDSAGARIYVGLEDLPTTGAATVTAFDATSLTPIVSSDTGGGGLGGPHVAAGGKDIWVSYATGMMGQVEHRKASDLALLPVAQTMHTNGVQIFVIAGMVWVADAMAGQLMCLDPQTGVVRAVWSTQQGGVIDGDGSALYFGDITGVGTFQPDARCL